MVASCLTKFSRGLATLTTTPSNAGKSTEPDSQCQHAAWLTQWGQEWVDQRLFMPEGDQPFCSGFHIVTATWNVSTIQKLNGNFSILYLVGVSSYVGRT